MAEVTRIDVQEAAARLGSGEALLVCAYDNDQKFANYHLEGAISLAEFQERIGTLSRDQEIIFY